MDQEPAPKPASQKPKTEMSAERSIDRTSFLKSKLETVKSVAGTAAEAVGYLDTMVRKTNPTWEATKENPIPLPHAQAAAELFARKHPKELEVAQGVKELLWEFYNQELQNSTMYRTEDGQASLPYTYINVTDFARKLHDTYGRPKPKTTKKPASSTDSKAQTEDKKEEDVEPKTEIFFTFGSFLSPKGDGQFTFPEYAMHEFMKKFPTVLKQLEAGEKPDNYILYTIGYPTSLFGTISPEAVKQIEENPYSKSAEWYSQFVKNHLTPDTSHVRFWGESMGGHFETATAMRLVDENTLT